LLATCTGLAGSDPHVLYAWNSSLVAVTYRLRDFFYLQRNSNSTGLRGGICVSQNIDLEINLILWEVRFVFCVLSARSVFNFIAPSQPVNPKKP
jgi:hypothetical protein